MGLRIRRVVCPVTLVGVGAMASGLPALPSGAPAGLESAEAPGEALTAGPAADLDLEALPPAPGAASGGPMAAAVVPSGAEPEGPGAAEPSTAGARTALGEEQVAELWPTAAPAAELPAEPEPSLLEAAGEAEYEEDEGSLPIGTGPLELETWASARQEPLAIAQTKRSARPSGIPPFAALRPATVRSLASAGDAGIRLGEGVRAALEPVVGGRLKDVRVHTGEAAARMAEALEAEAFTIGQHVFFGRGRFDPTGARGRGLLAHELVHVRQQMGGGAGRVLGYGEGAGAGEAEAEAAEQAVLGGQLAGSGLTVGTYVRNYSSADGRALSPSDRARLDAISFKGLDVCRQLLGAELGRASAASIERLEIDLSLDLASATDDQAARAWGRALADAILAKLWAAGEQTQTSESQAKLQRAPAPKAEPSVPKWSQLPPYARKELEAAGLGEDWYNAPTEKPMPAAQPGELAAAAKPTPVESPAADNLRLTALALYVKLKGMGLWRFVTGWYAISPGVLEFRCSDVDKLKRTLRSRSDFRNPDRAPKRWASGEKRAWGQLHLKQFPNYADDQVQAHIDPRGFSGYAWQILSLGFLAAYQGLYHLKTYHGYKIPRKIREILLRQGWDPAVLLGSQPLKAAPQRKEESGSPADVGPAEEEATRVQRAAASRRRARRGKAPEALKAHVDERNPELIVFSRPVTLEEAIRYLWPKPPEEPNAIRPDPSDAGQEGKHTRFLVDVRSSLSLAFSMQHGLAEVYLRRIRPIRSNAPPPPPLEQQLAPWLPAAVRKRVLEMHRAGEFKGTSRRVYTFPGDAPWGRIVLWVGPSEFDSTQTVMEMYQYYPEDIGFYKSLRGYTAHAARLNHFARTVWNKDMKYYVEGKKMRPSEARLAIQEQWGEICRTFIGAVGMAFAGAGGLRSPEPAAGPALRRGLGGRGVRPSAPKAPPAPPQARPTRGAGAPAGREAGGAAAEEARLAAMRAEAAAARTRAPQAARAELAAANARGGPVRVNVGGTGEIKDAINLNPVAEGTGGAVTGIPNWVAAKGESIAQLFPRGSVDEIYARKIFTGSVNWEQAAKGFHAVLKRGGKVSLNEFPGGAERSAVIVSALEKAGFRDIKVIAKVLVEAVK